MKIIPKIPIFVIILIYPRSEVYSFTEALLNPKPNIGNISLFLKLLIMLSNWAFRTSIVDCALLSIKTSLIEKKRFFIAKFVEKSLVANSVKKKIVTNTMLLIITPTFLFFSIIEGKMMIVRKVMNVKIYAVLVRLNNIEVRESRIGIIYIFSFRDINLTKENAKRRYVLIDALFHIRTIPSYIPAPEV